MADRTDNRTVYLIVGGLLVAVLGLWLYNANKLANSDDAVMNGTEPAATTITNDITVPATVPANEGTSMTAPATTGSTVTSGSNASDVSTPDQSTGAVSGTTPGADTTAPGALDQPVTDTTVESGVDETSGAGTGATQSTTTTTTP